MSNDTVWVVLDQGGLVDVRYLLAVCATEDAAIQYIDRDYADMVAIHGLQKLFIIEEWEILGEQ